jgi:PAS domain S-box-containing protein
MKRVFDGAFSLREFTLATAVLWTVLVVSSFLWQKDETRRNTLEQARIQARIAYDKDVLYRRWNAGHGGVYVPVTSRNEPNPYLAHLPERDIASTTGRQFTLLNPAYMTRQVNELGQGEHDVVGHLTSLRSLRPGNAADPWETRALQAFERGVTEVVSVEPLNGVEHLRLMRPFVTEEACLKCHGAQGYRVGEIRGGISVSVPMAPLTELADRHIAVIGATHLLLWLAGLGCIAGGGWWLVRVERERHSVEEELNRERETLRLLYEHNPDAVAVIDRDCRVTYANHRVQELTGVSLGVLRQSTCHQGILGKAAPCEGCRLEEVFREGRPVARVKHEVTASGRENWLWQQWYPVRGAGGGVESVVEIARDVTELKNVEAELRRHATELEKANHIKDLFTDIMSHDLLNPATAARYFLELLREKEPDPERLKLIEKVERNLAKLAEMIESAASYSRLNDTREIDVKTEDLGRIVREVLADLQPQVRTAGMSVGGPPEGRFPAAVNPMFANVVANLVGNAVKYAATGGRIALDIRDGGHEWVLSVADRGEGIPDAHKENIFSRFERVKKEGVKGAGLGLAIARRIVELHGGRIWVEDNPAGGSIFLVALRKAVDEIAAPHG